jgi:hypothetical protein
MFEAKVPNAFPIAVFTSLDISFQQSVWQLVLTMTSTTPFDIFDTLAMLPEERDSVERRFSLP